MVCFFFQFLNKLTDLPHISLMLTKKLMIKQYYFQGIEYETCWLAGRTTKFSLGLPPKREKRPFSSNSNLSVPANDKSPVSTPPMDKVKMVSETRQLENGNAKISNGKPKFANDTQIIENGTHKVISNKPKTMHPKRRVTKQRSDALPDVIEDSVDVQDSQSM